MPLIDRFSAVERGVGGSISQSHHPSVEMIEYAGHGVAMKNGIDELKNIANAITPFTNDENGLAKYLQDYFQLSELKANA